MRPQASRASSPNPTANLVGSRRAGLANAASIVRGVCHFGARLRLGLKLLAPPHLSVTLRQTARVQLAKLGRRHLGRLVRLGWVMGDPMPFDIRNAPQRSLESAQPWRPTKT